MMTSNHVNVPQSDARRGNFIKSITDRFPSKVFTYFLGRTCNSPITKRDIPGAPPPPPFDTPDMMIPQESDPGSQSIAKRSSGASGTEYPDEVYVHTKTWIVDDVYAMIGSANCNRRSMTNDSECSIHFTDEALWNGARAVVRNYRMDLWAEHLNMQTAEARAMLEDPTLALHFWKNPVPGARQRPFVTPDTAGTTDLDATWGLLYDPDGR
jgi:phosphatidylserine/phosphatidylglycerophosphate/cardiolipin synthase-like enzyme